MLLPLLLGLLMSLWLLLWLSCAHPRPRYTVRMLTLRRFLDSM